MCFSQIPSFSNYGFAELIIRINFLAKTVGSPWPAKLVGKMGATTLSITTFTLMTLNIRGLHVTLSLSDSQHKKQSAKRCSAIMLSVIMLSASVVMLNVVELIVVAQEK